MKKDNGQAIRQLLPADRIRLASEEHKVWFSQPFIVAQQFTGLEGKYVKLADTLRNFNDIVEGKADDVPEQAFLYVGTIDEVREKAKKM